MSEILQSIEKALSEKQQDKKFKKVEVVKNDVPQITIPNGMSYERARKWLKRKEEHEESFVEFSATLDVHPMDGARALYKVCQEHFGWASLEAMRTTGFLGMQIETPPEIIEVQTGFNESEQVPWGAFHVPGLDGGWFHTTRQRVRGRYKFRIAGSCKRKDEATVQKVIQKVRDFLKEHSIYKGQAICPEGDGNQPEFVDISKVDPLILPEETGVQVETSIFTPIRNAEECKAAGIPLKRGILLHGPYGTGKTLCARTAAKLAVQHGWTFVYLKNVADLPKSLEFAKQYQPAVVFAEDLDRAVGSQERTEQIDAVLNSIDGLTSKDTAIMTVLTTNHLETINRAMLRPGRLDAVIRIGPPDVDAAIALIERYGSTSLDDDADAKPAAEILSGQIPAVIRESVERAKLFAIRRNGSAKVGTEDLALSAKQMVAQVQALKDLDVPEGPPAVEQALRGLVSETTVQALRETLDEDIVVG